MTEHTEEYGKWFLNHSNGEVYSFHQYDMDAVKIKHNGKNCQDVFPDEHHSDGCYRIADAREQWNALTSQGFNKQ